MNDFARFVSDCISSGAILYGSCALLIVPFASWLAVRWVVPIVRGMDGDPEWQAPLAAASVLVPAVLLLLSFGAASVSGAFLVCTRTFTGRLLFGALIVVTAISLVRAVRRSVRRHDETRALLALTVVPSTKLRAVAAELGVTLRELPDNRPFCALVGGLSAQVVVSSGTVDLLRHGELRAAVLHERGHARRFDHVVAALLAFLVDVLPLPSRALLELYREARESAADRHALRGASPEDLAGALLTFIRTGQTFAHLASLYGERGVSMRLRALLESSTIGRVSVASRLASVAALGIIFVMGLVPVHAAMRTLVPRGDRPLVAAVDHVKAIPRVADRCKLRRRQT